MVHISRRNLRRRAKYYGPHVAARAEDEWEQKQKPKCDLSKLNTWLYIVLRLTVFYIFFLILIFTIDTLSNWYN